MVDYVSYRIIPGFPEYRIGSDGHIYNTRSTKWLQWTPNQNGEMTVGLMKDGRQYRRSVKVLVAKVFVPGQSLTMDTPVLKDGDRTHLNADNIVWRPRWFAWTYIHQFKGELPGYADAGPVLDCNTETIYETIYDTAIHTCQLMRDILLSAQNGNRVYPTGHIYAFHKG